MNRILRSSNPLVFRSMKYSGARQMGSHGGPPPTGWEAKVRKVFPNDHEIVLATLGIYASIFLLFKMWPSSKKPVVEAIAATTESGSSTIPSIMDDSFDEWSKVPGNMEKWEKSLENLEGFGDK